MAEVIIGLHVFMAGNWRWGRLGNEPSRQRAHHPLRNPTYPGGVRGFMHLVLKCDKLLGIPPSQKGFDILPTDSKTNFEANYLHI